MPKSRRQEITSVGSDGEKMNPVHCWQMQIRLAIVGNTEVSQKVKVEPAILFLGISPKVYVQAAMNAAMQISLRILS